MALLFMDSFDHYTTTHMADKWTSRSGGTVSATYARHGSGGYYPLSGASKTLPAQTTLVCGASIKPIALGGTVASPIFSLTHVSRRSDGDRGLQLLLLNSGQLALYGSGNTSLLYGAVLGTSVPPYALQDGVWAYVELKMTTQGLSSVVTVRINNHVALTGTGDTRVQVGLFPPTYVSEWNMFLLGGVGNSTFAVDDLYVGNLAGGRYTDFLGEVRIDAHYPTGPGAYAQWFRGGADSGANWNQVNEADPNDDTDYNQASLTDLIDTFDCTDFVPEGNDLLAIQHVMAACKTDAGAAQIAPVIRQGTTDYVGTVSAPGQSTYAYFLDLHETPPAGGTWDEATFEAMEVGYKAIEAGT